MNLSDTWKKPVNLIQTSLDSCALFLLRIWVGQEFLLAGYTKLMGGLTPPEWFSSLNFPFPLAAIGPNLNWLIAGVCEILFGSALIIGVSVRFASFILIYITYVAIYTVHSDLGWQGWNVIESESGNGFKVPMMIGLMLFTLLAMGAGSLSLDYWIRKLRNNDKNSGIALS